MSLTPTSGSPKKWGSYLSNKKLSRDEKVNLMQENIKLIEEKALRKEKLLKQLPLPSETFSYDSKTTEVNDMLIDAIKAKLAMLDEIR